MRWEIMWLLTLRLYFGVPETFTKCTFKIHVDQQTFKNLISIEIILFQKLSENVHVLTANIANMNNENYCANCYEHIHDAVSIICDDCERIFQMTSNDCTTTTQNKYVVQQLTFGIESMDLT